MTLITNEIHVLSSLNQSAIISTADRRISRSNKYDSTKRKLFEIEYLNGAISFFGLAEVFPKGKKVYLSDWLREFILRQADCGDLEEFSSRLKEALHSVIPSEILSKSASGFHIAGYNSNGYPDFFHFSNIGRNENLTYSDFRSQYSNPSSHYLNRDAITHGWDGENPESIQNIIRIYRNGDIRAHIVAWDELDKIFLNLFLFPEFKRPSTITEYGEYVKMKLKILAYFQKRLTKYPIVAPPIDVLCIYKINEKIEKRWIMRG